jgi:hypothetical protein
MGFFRINMKLMGVLRGGWFMGDAQSSDSYRWKAFGCESEKLYRKGRRRLVCLVSGASCFFAAILVSPYIRKTSFGEILLEFGVLWWLGISLFLLFFMTFSRAIWLEERVVRIERWWVRMPRVLLSIPTLAVILVLAAEFDAIHRYKAAVDLFSLMALIGLQIVHGLILYGVKKLGQEYEIVKVEAALDQLDLFGEVFCVPKWRIQCRPERTLDLSWGIVFIGRKRSGAGCG